MPKPIGSIINNWKTKNVWPGSIEESGIDLDRITQKLEDGEIKKFNAFFDALLKVIGTQRKKSNTKA